MSSARIRVDEGDDQFIVGAEADGLKVAVLVDDQDDLDTATLAPVISELCQEIGHIGQVNRSRGGAA